jgi:ABC-2 type transport system ATP-binding protein
VVAEGTPDALKSKIGGDRLDVVVRDPRRLAEAAAIIERVTGAPAEPDRDTARLSAPVSDRVRTLTAALNALAAAGIEAEDVALRRPTLDEVFLQLTGGDRR